MRQSKPTERLDRQYLQISPKHAGRRIDNFLHSCLSELPRSFLYRIVRSGEVRVNQGRIQPSYRLQEGDWVRIPPLYRHARKQAGQVQVPAELCRQVEKCILYEQGPLLVLNKPAGLAVHGGTGLKSSLLAVLRAIRPEPLELAHRLDRETSGCLLLCSDPRLLREFHQMFRLSRVRKTYQDLLAGHPQAKIEIDLPLKRVPGKGMVRQVVVSASGRAACSRLHRRRRFAQASLVDLQALTGRTHQLRMHVRAIGHPLAGDRKYGERAFNRDMRALGLRRMFLHASSLQLPMPGGLGGPGEGSGRELRFQAALPEELEDFLRNLPPYR